MQESAPAEPVQKLSADGKINIVSPLDGRIVERVDATPLSELGGLAQRARAAQAGWAEVPLKDRAATVKGLAKGLAAAAEEIVEILRVEVGRHPAESWFAEIVPDIELIQWWCGKGRKHLELEKIPLSPLSYPRKKASVRLIPRGVLGLITPWNYPVAIPLRALVPAVLGGNAVLWKPSEYSALVSQRLGRVLNEVLPPDLVHVVQGDGKVGAAVIEQVDGIGFTGSLATGRAIAVRAAERMIPCSTELGGKDFAVVMPDADLKRTAAGIAWGAMTNAGQNCASIEVVCVHESIAPKFTELVKEEVRAMAPYVGPVINAAQQEKVSDHIADAVEGGGLIAEGGMTSGDGLRIEPTVIERLPWDRKAVCEETFGPILPVQTFRDLSEVDEQLHRGTYGLTLSVWTKDIPAAKRWAEGQPVGVVSFNNHGFTAAIPALPWTGVKGSGLGVTNGPYSLEWMVRPQGMLEDRAGGRELWWHPFNEAALKIARGMTALTGGVGSKWEAIKNVVSGMLGRWKDGP